MSVVKLPVTRPAGRILLVGGESCRSEPLSRLRELGFQCVEIDDPYQAMAALARQPRHFGAVVLSLLSLYREELQIIAAIKRRWPHVEIWLTQTDGRAAAMAEAMRLGADGLLTEDGLQRIVAPPLSESSTSISPVSSPIQRVNPPAPARETVFTPPPPAGRYNELDDPCEPVLTVDELRALLQDAPSEI